MTAFGSIVFCAPLASTTVFWRQPVSWSIAGHAALKRIASMPQPWTARFVCELAYVAGDAVQFTARGTVEGEIARVPRGIEGFGYDPIFFYPPYGQTLGEVAGVRKLAVVHRGQAFRAFRAWLESVNLARS